jgi:hypothetical protein
MVMTRREFIAEPTIVGRDAMKSGCIALRSRPFEECQLSPRHRPSLQKSLRAIERAFVDIERSFEDLSKRIAQTASEAARRSKPVPMKRLTRPATPKRLAQRKLHGSYIGHLRHLKPAQKLRVKAVKEKRGFEAAIRVAKRIARG